MDDEVDRLIREYMDKMDDEVERLRREYDAEYRRLFPLWNKEDSSSVEQYEEEEEDQHEEDEEEDEPEPSPAPSLSSNGPEPRQAHPSLWQLMRQHPREPLWVPPGLLWKQIHLRVLGCEFVDDGVVSLPGRKWTWSGRQHIFDARAFATYADGGGRWEYFRRMVEEKHRFHLYEYLTFVACGVVSKVQYLCMMTLAPRAPHNHKRNIACIDLGDLERFRKRCIHPCRYKPRPNKLYGKLEEDPYLVCLLIALAQKGKDAQEESYRQTRGLREYDAEMSWERHWEYQMLLATVPGNKEWLHVYRSRMPKAFLARFEDVKTPPPVGVEEDDLKMVVYRQRVTFEPIKTFRERLFAVIEEGFRVDGCAGWSAMGIKRRS